MWIREVDHKTARRDGLKEPAFTHDVARGSGGPLYLPVVPLLTLNQEEKKAFQSGGCHVSVMSDYIDRLS